MVEEIKWTLAFIIAVIITIVGGFLVVKFGPVISKSTLDWILAISIPLAFVLVTGFVKWTGGVKKSEMEKIFMEINKKANESDTLAREALIINSLKDQKEINKVHIDAIHEFMASIDSELKSINSYLLNNKEGLPVKKKKTQLKTVKG